MIFHRKNEIAKVVLQFFKHIIIEKLIKIECIIARITHFQQQKHSFS
jgi:hypothetical protein